MDVDGMEDFVRAHLRYLPASKQRLFHLIAGIGAAGDATEVLLTSRLPCSTGTADKSRPGRRCGSS